MAVRAKPLFGRYMGAELLGAGVSGEVYRATDSLLGRVVAVRVLARRLNDDLTARQRFIRETLAAAPLSAHPHAVTVYDVDDWEGQAYVVMDYLPGGSLEERLQEDGAQPPDRVLVWIDQAAAALDAAHEAGIAHGEVEPANLLLDAQGDVQVGDFGAAAAVPLARASPAGDRYALGTVAFELLSARKPTGGEPASVANASLPHELDAVFAIALAQDPTEHYGTCAEFAAALRAAFANAAPTTLIRAPEVEPARRAGRSRLLWSLLALLALAALAGGIWATLLNSGGTRDAAQSAATPARQAHITSSGREHGRPIGQIRPGIVEPGLALSRTSGPPRVSTWTAGHTPAGEIAQTIKVTVYDCRSGSLRLRLAARSSPAHLDVSFERLKSADVLVRGSTRLWIPVQREAGDDTACVFYLSPRGAVRSSGISFDRGPAPIPTGVPLRRLGPGVTQVATKASVTPSRTPAWSTYGIRVGYCFRGQFLELEYNQARTDTGYKGATLANFVAGQGLTCAQPPPGYVRHGFATSDLGVPPGVYPYYSSP
jgi:serine/threonine protein kinase